MRTDLSTTEVDTVPFEVPGEGSSRVRERIAIDVEGAMAAMSAMDDAKLERGKRGEKLRFLSPAQFPVGINVLKILPPWTRTPPHAGRFWRAVWVHFGLGPSGETKTALCARRMNRLGLPRMKGEESLGRCPVCEGLEAIWAIPFDDRTADEKRFLADYKARLNYLFNVVWLKGGAHSHIDEGTYLFSCSPSLGEPILTAFKFVLSMKPAEVPDNFDVQIKKLPSKDKVFNGKPVYEYQEVFPSIPTAELDLADPKFERYPLDVLYRQKEAHAVEQLFRQTPCGAALLAGSAVDVSPRERPALPPHSPDSEEEPPFRHGPAETGPATAAPTRTAAQLPLRSREPGEDDLDEATLTAMAARGRGREAPSPRDQLEADLLKAARR